ncbi:MAG: U32 family peptidase [Candidatus Omnitrophica bacterium]|nr:U32 family peptidase [Candidatus Omnitrophota bacterium]
MKKIELLAPAGTRETLEAVIEAGADAVYLSGKRYSMRQHGNWLHFEDRELKSAIEYAHGKNVKVYLTMNNLLTSGEMGAVREYFSFLEEINSDAVILHDLGLLQAMNELGIKIPRHASTMMNVHHRASASILKRHGVTRIITSRDITVYQANEIAQSSGLEVEYFVHGDMCVAQSSQCFHSGVSTSMSSNRGKCLKSCRWQWDLVDRSSSKILAQVEEKYVLARKDICLFHQIPELVAANIASLKIEGRARKLEYLMPIVSAYRKAIDRYYENPSHYRTDFNDLAALKKHTIREVDGNHAFSRPGLGSTGLDGEREPRIFSIAVQEKPYSETDAARLLETINVGVDVSLPELSVRCGDLKTAMALTKSSCDWIYVGGELFSGPFSTSVSRDDFKKLITQCHQVGKKIGIQTPRITTERELLEIEQLIGDLADCPPDEYLVHNLGALQVVRKLTHVPVHADFSLNVWNPPAINFLKGEGVSFLTPGVELNLHQILNLASQSALPMECLIHGSVPGMILDYCVIGAHMTGTTKYDSCSGPCTGLKYALRSRLNDLYFLEADQYCRNHVFMSKDLCTVDILESFFQPSIKRLRIEGMLYDAPYLLRLVELYGEKLKTVREESKPDSSWAALFDSLKKEAPRPFSLGPYGNPNEDISEPLSELPTNLIISYTESPKLNILQ